MGVDDDNSKCDGEPLVCPLLKAYWVDGTESVLLLFESPSISWGALAFCSALLLADDDGFGNSPLSSFPVILKFVSMAGFRPSNCFNDRSEERSPLTGFVPTTFLKIE